MDTAAPSNWPKTVGNGNQPLVPYPDFLALMQTEPDMDRVSQPFYFGLTDLVARSYLNVPGSYEDLVAIITYDVRPIEDITFFDGKKRSKGSLTLRSVAIESRLHGTVETELPITEEMRHETPSCFYFTPISFFSVPAGPRMLAFWTAEQCLCEGRCNKESRPIRHPRQKAAVSIDNEASDSDSDDSMPGLISQEELLEQERQAGQQSESASFDVSEYEPRTHPIPRFSSPYERQFHELAARDMQEVVVPTRESFEQKTT